MLESNVNSVLSRLKSFFDVTRDSELARALGISPQTLSSWRQREAIPYSICAEIAQEHSLSLDWVLYGAQIEQPPTHPSSTEALIQELLTHASTLPAEDLSDLINQAHAKSRLKHLEQACTRISEELQRLKSGFRRDSSPTPPPE